MSQFIYSKSSLSLIEMMALVISITQSIFLFPLKIFRAALTPTIPNQLLQFLSVSSWAVETPQYVLIQHWGKLTACRANVKPSYLQMLFINSTISQQCNQLNKQYSCFTTLLCNSLYLMCESRVIILFFFLGISFFYYKR